MTSLETSTLIPVLTPAGIRIPARGTIACHPLLGFGEVVTRSGSRLRIVITDPVAGAAERLAAVSAARTSGAEIEIAGLEALLNPVTLLLDSIVLGHISASTVVLAFS